MSRLDLSKFFSPIASKLEAVEEELQSAVQCEFPVVRRLAKHVSRGSGKRLRPALVLLVSRFCGNASNEDVRYGAVFELLHTATLIHDDVIDHASTRRGRPSLNAAWGNTQSVLFGDFLYMLAVRSALAGRSWRMMEIFADVTTLMVEGELIQNECLYSLDTSKQTYFDILERKTAMLFAGCAECGAVIADKTKDVCQSLYRFGLELGRAFQLVDDLLDYTSNSGQLGKPVFSDLHEGKLTLPMLLLLEREPEKATALIQRVWAGDSSGISPEDATTLREMLERQGILDEIHRLAGQASKTAMDSLPVAGGDPEIARLLLEIPQILLDRNY